MCLMEVGLLMQAIVTWLLALLPDAAVAAFLLVAGWWLSNWAARATGRIIDRQSQFDPTLRGVATSLVRYVILIPVFVASLAQLGIQTTSILAAVGAAGLAIGLALQGTLANVAAGIMLLWLKPFRIGDDIRVGDSAGTVKEVGLFATEMHTADGVYQFVPNSEIWNKRLFNYSRLPTRLIEAKFSIGYGAEIEAGRRVLLDLANADARVLPHPPAEVFVSALGENAVELSLRAWSRTADFSPTLRLLIEKGKGALQQAGIAMPR
jgi:small conductance mechanosensitive channel